MYELLLLLPKTFAVHYAKSRVPRLVSRRGFMRALGLSEIELAYARSSYGLGLEARYVIFIDGRYVI